MKAGTFCDFRRILAPGFVSGTPRQSRGSSRLPAVRCHIAHTGGQSPFGGIGPALLQSERDNSEMDKNSLMRIYEVPPEETKILKHSL
mgnify:CR=1 FL=1